MTVGFVSDQVGDNVRGQRRCDKEDEGPKVVREHAGFQVRGGQVAVAELVPLLEAQGRPRGPGPARG